MKKRYLATGVALAMFGASALAAIAEPPHIGSTCSGTHWINPKSETTDRGYLYVYVNGSGTPSCVVQAYKALSGGTQHFSCPASGTVTAAFTLTGFNSGVQLPGKLVISDCFGKPEPPKCDPKVEKCD